MEIYVCSMNFFISMRNVTNVTLVTRDAWFILGANFAGYVNLNMVSMSYTRVINFAKSESLCI